MNTKKTMLALTVPLAMSVSAKQIDTWYKQKQEQSKVNLDTSLMNSIFKEIITHPDAEMRVDNSGRRVYTIKDPKWYDFMEECQHTPGYAAKIKQVFDGSVVDAAPFGQLSLGDVVNGGKLTHGSAVGFQYRVERSNQAPFLPKVNNNGSYPIYDKRLAKQFHGRLISTRTGK